MNKSIPKITQQQVVAYLKARPHDSHKGLFGEVAVVGGERGMVGAALLAGRAALKLGAGCVHVYLLADDAPVVDGVQPELMLHAAGDGVRCGAGCVFAIGCGLGGSIAARKLLLQALQSSQPLVLDADALNLLARHSDLQEDLRTRRADAIITPHPGEAARLLGITTAAVQADRIQAAQALAQQLQCDVVLKGADTLCAGRNGELHINKTGNPGMSTAGMGDVLAGMIAAFIAQGLEAGQAMQLAVHLHGAAGDALAREGVAVGMTASDVTEWARWLLNQWLSDA